MKAQARAEILINKYSKGYIKELVNGMITMHRKDDNIKMLNHWNEIALIIKSKSNEKTT